MIDLQHTPGPRQEIYAGSRQPRTSLHFAFALRISERKRDRPWQPLQIAYMQTTIAEHTQGDRRGPIVRTKLRFTAVSSFEKAPALGLLPFNPPNDHHFVLAQAAQEAAGAERLPDILRVPPGGT